jgi:hypothetical protein
MKQFNSEFMVNTLIVYFKKDIDGDTLINGEKYKSFNSFNQMSPVYDNPVYLPKINLDSLQKSVNTAVENVNDNLTELLIDYGKPCLKLTDKCLHELTASCPFCDKADLDHIVNKIKAQAKIPEPEPKDMLTGLISSVSIQSQEGEELNHVEVKRKRGRPRKTDIVVKEGGSRKNTVQVEYLKRRYRDDEEFKTKCLQNGKVNYRLKKEEKEIKNMLSKKQLKSMYNRKYREKNNLD